MQNHSSRSFPPKDCKIDELLSAIKPYLDNAPMDETSRQGIARRLT
jgi:hypothetical protein